MGEGSSRFEESPFAAAAAAFNPASTPLGVIMAVSLQFWARRAHAHGAYLEEISENLDPAKLAAANMRFLARLQEDYADSFLSLLHPEKAQARGKPAPGGPTRD